MQITKKALAVLKATSTEELHEHMESYDGFCLRCGEWSEGGVEPDAEDYECQNCGSHSLCGAEQVVSLTL
jgi:hypothetical protein